MFSIVIKVNFNNINLILLNKAKYSQLDSMDTSCIHYTIIWSKLILISLHFVLVDSIKSTLKIQGQSNYINNANLNLEINNYTCVIFLQLLQSAIHNILYDLIKIAILFLMV